MLTWADQYKVNPYQGGPFLLLWEKLFIGSPMAFTHEVFVIYISQHAKSLFICIFNPSGTVMEMFSEN